MATAAQQAERAYQEELARNQARKEAEEEASRKLLT
jgi:hypothetical protein